MGVALAGALSPRHGFRHRLGQLVSGAVLRLLRGTVGSQCSDFGGEPGASTRPESNLCGMSYWHPCTGILVPCAVPPRAPIPGPMRSYANVSKSVGCTPRKSVNGCFGISGTNQGGSIVSRRSRGPRLTGGPLGTPTGSPQCLLCGCKAGVNSSEVAYARKPASVSRRRRSLLGGRG